MATVNKEMADELVKLNGQYEDDPLVMRIVEYDNVYGGVAYGIEYGHQLGKYRPSEFVRNPRVYWVHENCAKLWC